jgi:SAM-dependent methyltransferase
MKRGIKLMHDNAMHHGKIFFETYCSEEGKEYKVVEIGSYDVCGSLRDVKTSNVTEYIGVDFNPGPGVDVILEDPYSFPFPDNTFDALVTTSCFEHSELFWITFLECLRIVKPDGVIYFNAPSSWMCYHQYPVDCWRFYPDSARALETWARYSKINAKALESYVSVPSCDAECADMIGVYVKDEKFIDKYPKRMIDSQSPYYDYVNAFRFPQTSEYPRGWEYPTAPYAMGIRHPGMDMQLRNKSV